MRSNTLAQLEHWNNFLVASRKPLQDIERVSYEGQNPMMRQYRSGYEDYLENLPVLDAGDPFLEEKVSITQAVMGKLAHELKDASWVKMENIPAPGGFNRTIIAMEEPSVDVNGDLKEGKELIVAKWGDGHTSPVHGHAAGYLHEDILFGKMKVMTYRIVDRLLRLVRPISVDIVGPGTFMSGYAQPTRENQYRRDVIVHNFTSIGESASLHYVPEHTRDGRDNGFQVEYFDDMFEYGNSDLTRITSKEGMYSRIGDVILVRSMNVPEYGDHYIVITGKPTMKEHGLRPAETAIPAPTNVVLDKYEMENGLILLKLNDDARETFLRFHGITVKDNVVTFPEP